MVPNVNSLEDTFPALWCLLLSYKHRLTLSSMALPTKNCSSPGPKADLLATCHQVEDLINDHIAHQRDGTHQRSKLKLLVPSVGLFFTPLLLEEAFEYQDQQRRISSRRFVPPSFNDIPDNLEFGSDSESGAKWASSVGNI